MSISQNEILYNKYMKLKELREENDYKQAFIANYIGVKQNAYSQYETGKRQIPIEALIKLADLYNVSIDYLLGLTEEETHFRKNKQD
ncbi:MAG: helix-turn-helix transcriptional regulator [Clostridia bacterium]|nr:helix-turn-helix transcriptional regulator [Clostridia bacterium]